MTFMRIIIILKNVAIFVTMVSKVWEDNDVAEVVYFIIYNNQSYVTACKSILKYKSFQKSW